MNPQRNIFSPQELLRDYSPRIQRLANRLREIILQCVPAAKEKAYQGWRVIGYRDQFYFCCIMPKPESVELAFEYGYLLDDPDQLLLIEDTQMRRVTYRSLNHIKVRSLKRLIQQASQIKP